MTGRPSTVDGAARTTPRPLVSVLVNNYNYGRYLGEALDTALNQTYDNVEVVVVDDGSTDDSRQVIDRYTGRVRPLLTENRGQAAAISAGLRLVRGDIVLLLDSDDTLDADVVERVVREFARDERCARVQFRLRVRTAEGTDTGATVPPANWPLLTGDLSGHVKRYRMFRSPPTSGNAWRTSVLRGLPEPPAELRTYVDRWYSELTALAGTVRAVEGPGGGYRVHATNHHTLEGHGLSFFRTRIDLTERLHRAGQSVARDLGHADYPSDVLAPMDAAFLAWRLAAHKLDPQAAGSAYPWRLVARGAWAALLQPAQPLPSRVWRAGWILALAAAPPGSRLLRWLLATRYERGTH